MLNKKKVSPVPALVCGLLLLVAVWFFFGDWRRGARVTRTEDGGSGESENRGMLVVQEKAARGVDVDEREVLARLAARERTAAEWQELLRRRLERKTARVKEAIVILKDEDAYRRFQARARAAGFLILRQSENLRAVRVRYDTIAAVQADVFEYVRDYEEIGANAFVDRPTKPAEDSDEGAALAVGRGLLSGLGVVADRSQWGRGVTIAVLDSGVASDATFGGGRVRALDVGQGLAPGRGEDDGHGTAVAAIAAGAASDAEGVAPAAQVLSVRVTAEDGRSDIFTVAEGIVVAVEAGAKVINISLGGYDTSVLLTRAVDYAEAAGALIVAASGNDRAAILAWPAAEPRVISVGATDAIGRVAKFSNGGEGLRITAPGVGVRSAWLEGRRVLFGGTSASAPVVSGAIAAVMSQVPGRTAREAWEIVEKRTDDAGAPGADADYGAGVLNLGWAMAVDPARVDLAVASHWMVRAEESGGTGGAPKLGEVVDVVVQNRGGFTVAGAVLEIEAGGVKSRQVLPAVAAGASEVLKVPVNRIRQDEAGRWVLKTRLVTPGGMVDLAPENNERVSALQVSGR